MRIAIAGAGSVGRSIAGELVENGHEVMLIDREPSAFRRLGTDFHGQQVTGVGFDRDVLIKARISEAHAFAAVSSGDNSNIIAARVAREQFNVETVVARIYDAKRAQVYERLGIPTVATVPWTTDRLLRAIIPEGLISEWRDPSGTVTIVNLPYHRHWIGRPLAEFEAAIGVHTAFVVRFGRGLLPTHDTVVQEGDLIYASVLSKDVHDVGDKATISPVDGL